MAWVVTAVVTAAELMTAAAIFTAVAEVGIAMTVVGKITKSKELVKIGGIMSLVGGIGSLATSAYGALSAAGAGEGAVGVAEGAAVGAASDVAGEQFALEAGMDAAGSGFGAAAAEGAATTFPVDVPTLGGMMGSAPATPAAATGVAPAAAGPIVAAPTPAPAAATAAPAPGVTGAAFDAGSAGAVTAPADTSAFGIKKWFDGLDKATQGKVISGAVQIGGNAIGGLFNGWSEEQKMALEQQRQSLVQKNLETQQANANAQPRVQAYVKPTGMMTS
jgi:hypothetical protein